MAVGVGSAKESPDVAGAVVWFAGDGDEEEAERIVELEDNVEEERDTMSVDEPELDDADVDVDEVLDSTFELGTSTAKKSSQNWSPLFSTRSAC